MRRDHDSSHRDAMASTSEDVTIPHDLVDPHHSAQSHHSKSHVKRREWIPVLMIYVWLACGGALGTMSRYAVSGWVVHRLGPSTLGTFTVNIAGSFLIGLILVLTQYRVIVPSDVRLFLAIGFLGGFTTFSTFMFETMGLVENRSLLNAALNAGGSVVTGLIAVWLGMTVAQLM